MNINKLTTTALTTHKLAVLADGKRIGTIERIEVAGRISWETSTGTIHVDKRAAAGALALDLGHSIPANVPAVEKRS